MEEAQGGKPRPISLGEEQWCVVYDDNLHVVWAAQVHTRVYKEVSWSGPLADPQVELGLRTTWLKWPALFSEEYARWRRSPLGSGMKRRPWLRHNTAR